jgi:hypothetical protein
VLPRLRRLIPVLGLLVLAPWVGEYLLGNIPASQLFALPFLMPLYGGGALLIREVARRTGRGWPTILLLGAAYGIIEAGLVDQSLFNPSFEGHEFQRITPIPLLGFSAYYAITFVVGHVIWSIGIPIAVVEFLTPARWTTPWLGGWGLAVTGLFYLLGCAIIFDDLRVSEGFMASRGQIAGTTLVAVVLIVIALVGPRRRPVIGMRPVPRPLFLGVATFFVASIYTARPENWLGGVVLALVLLGVAAGLVAHWSRQRGWGMPHQFALVAGLMPTYAWLGFVLTLLIRPNDRIAWIGNMVFAIASIALLSWIGRVVLGRSRVRIARPVAPR